MYIVTQTNMKIRLHVMQRGDGRTEKCPTKYKTQVRETGGWVKNNFSSSAEGDIIP